MKNIYSFFKNKFAADQNIIGVVIITGNKVLGCDMFATHELFTKQFESLLHSYATVTYYHNFEQAAMWSKLLELMDAVYHLSTQKLLFEKIVA